MLLARIKKSLNFCLLKPENDFNGTSNISMYKDEWGEAGGYRKGGYRSGYRKSGHRKSGHRTGGFRRGGMKIGSAIRENWVKAIFFLMKN